MSWFLKALGKYATFDGRARRKEYWFFFLFSSVFLFGSMFMDALTGSLNPETGLGAWSGLCALALLIPHIAVTVRRLHDTGRSGWWIWISFIPLLGAIVMLIFLVLRGDAGANEYGADPKVESLLASA